MTLTQNGIEHDSNQDYESERPLSNHSKSETPEINNLLETVMNNLNQINTEIETGEHVASSSIKNNYVTLGNDHFVKGKFLISTLLIVRKYYDSKRGLVQFVRNHQFQNQKI
jgi:hypothetical protein